ncbi:MAG TPA: hypothetical protein VGF48_19315 [Thermoanaerobaculia bacterium]|jgi:hypothetical protein
MTVQHDRFAEDDIRRRLDHILKQLPEGSDLWSEVQQLGYIAIATARLVEEQKQKIASD